MLYADAQEVAQSKAILLYVVKTLSGATLYWHPEWMQRLLTCGLPPSVRIVEPALNQTASWN